ncbi:MAG: hypothetical protein Q8P61_03035 [Candidatus Nanopelagicales bacterium]|nr:hypothetical protein [Candidatus Nanopelagicales bacterium]
MTSLAVLTSFARLRRKLKATLPRACSTEAFDQVARARGGPSLPGNAMSRTENRSLLPDLPSSCLLHRIGAVTFFPRWEIRTRPMITPGLLVPGRRLVPGWGSADPDPAKGARGSGSDIWLPTVPTARVGLGANGSWAELGTAATMAPITPAANTALPRRSPGLFLTVVHLLRPGRFPILARRP